MNKQILVALFFVGSISHGFTQNLADELITLAKVYRNFHFTNDPPQETLTQLMAVRSPELATAKEFIAELIKRNNQITAAKYLTRPDSITLKHLFIVRSINWNMHEANPANNHAIIDSLNKFPPSTYEQLACYYGMLFVSVGNKNKPLNMADTDLSIDTYGLKDDTEKGIFFLSGMDMFGTMIWGYMNIVKPPNHEKALNVINNYPKYNGQPYYQYQDLNFPDFKLTLDKTKPKESFKKYHINKYLNTLLYHSTALGQKKKTRGDQQNVMLGSIMKNESYYQYSDNPETFRQIFRKVNAE